MAAPCVRCRVGSWRSQTSGGQGSMPLLLDLLTHHPAPLASPPATQTLALVRESVLYAERELTAAVQYARAKGYPVIAYTGGPQLGAAGYDHRATFNGAARCEQCLQSKRGHKWGGQEAAARLDLDGCVAPQVRENVR
eukprot:1195711-Prorocentrum_minimum.AAC.8